MEFRAKITLLILFFSVLVCAEDRQHASNSERILGQYTDLYYQKWLDSRAGTDKTLQFRGGLAFGTSSLSNSDASADRARVLTKSHEGLALGVQGTFTEGRYFSLDFDGHFSSNVSPGRSSVSAYNETNDEVDNIDFTNEADGDLDVRTMSQPYGALLNYNVGLPLYLGDIFVRPRVGLGYALLGIKERLEVTGHFVSNTEKRIHGAFAVAGVDIEPINFLFISIDYSNSVWAEGKSILTGDIASLDSAEGASGIRRAETDAADLTADDPTDEVGPPTTQFQNAHFDRIRVGAYFRILDHCLLGAQYTRRSFLGQGVRDTQGQVMSLVLYEL